MNEIKEDVILHQTRWLSLLERNYVNKNGEPSKHILASRKPEPPFAPEKPDAVIIVSFYEDKLVLTSEYRVCVGDREIGFPAGIIDQSDWDACENEDDVIGSASCRAAIREFKEETGLDFNPLEVSPLLFSSAGMTNESVVVVHGNSTGTISKDFMESSEDIESFLLSHSELKDFLRENSDKLFGKHAWGMLWSFSHFGYPEW